MKRLVIRHAQSEANRTTRPAFGEAGAQLTKGGINQCFNLGVVLIAMGVDRKDEAVAVSEKIRTQQTARHVGFIWTEIYPILNEVSTNIPPLDLLVQLHKGQLPFEAIARAESILDDPPEERIWITHGLVIAGLREVLGMRSEPLVPGFCEVEEMTI